MPVEHQPRPRPQRPYEILGLTEAEQRSGRISDAKFQEIIKAQDTIIHEAKKSFNHYGDFLFVTLSRPAKNGRVFATFYGLGFHKFRERWIKDEWFWYQNIGNTGMQNTRIAPDEFEKQLQEHKEKTETVIKPDTQTQRGKLFELFANFADDDAALAYMSEINIFLLALATEPEEEQDD